jgi:hypothetical protein
MLPVVPDTPEVAIAPDDVISSAVAPDDAPFGPRSAGLPHANTLSAIPATKKSLINNPKFSRSNDLSDKEHIYVIIN